MSVPASQYIHPDDEKALTVLKAVPGFALLMRAFIRFFAEDPWKLIAISNCIRVTPYQYPELYSLLPPICRKLGICEPELYIQMDRQSNACTIGDQRPIVIVTSGLLESMDLNEVSAVLAHECGHIACHHVLYSTIAMYLESRLGYFFTVPAPVSAAVYFAIKHWQRCSELSADRAAAVCSGGSDEVIRVMMRLSGGCKNVSDGFSVAEYLKQAECYQQEVQKNPWAKIVNTYLVAGQDHPFTATRALEIDRWCRSDQFMVLEARQGRRYTWESI